MKFFITLLSLLNGASLAATIQPRQSEDDVTARLKAIEDFLATPDSSCVTQCENDAGKCARDCSRNSDVQEDYEFDVSSCAVKDAQVIGCLRPIHYRPVSSTASQQGPNARQR